MLLLGDLGEQRYNLTFPRKSVHWVKSHLGVVHAVSDSYPLTKSMRTVTAAKLCRLMDI